MKVLVMLPIAEASFQDIKERIEALGPDYADMLRQPGVIVLDGSEVALVSERSFDPEEQR